MAAVDEQRRRFHAVTDGAAVATAGKWIHAGESTSLRRCSAIAGKQPQAFVAHRLDGRAMPAAQRPDFPGDRRSGVDRCTSPQRLQQFGVADRNFHHVDGKLRERASEFADFIEQANDGMAAVAVKPRLDQFVEGAWYRSSAATSWNAM